jgi:predicted DNA binding CopG/RHH family protein
MSKNVPSFRSDEEAEAFLDQDLTEYLDLGKFQRVGFEFLPKTKSVNLRMPEPLLDAIKARAKQAGLSYQRYIRQVLERSVVADEPR